MTHAELVKAAARWLRATIGCKVVLSECGTAGAEIPDVIGWKSNGASVLVECKTSVDDFRADAGKIVRRRPEMGMGYLRWYFAVPGVIPLAFVPPGWGVAEVRRARVARIRNPISFLEHNVRRERILLISAVRRATDGWGMQVFDDLESLSALKERQAHLSAAISRRERESKRST